MLIWGCEEEALALQETVLNMGKPQMETLKPLRLWLDGKSEGRDGRTAPSFQGLQASRLNDEDDLVTLHPEFDRDWLSRIVDLPYLRYFCFVRIQFAAISKKTMKLIFDPAL